ncbi:DUF4865 family protein [Dactylosporangium sp. CA-152071]|uniref:DUF4865 family protein n=1 Tax=Dactylosporangium sp. CA-152071 TaxID=3239933 RepID=UPI003D93C3EE
MQAMQYELTLPADYDMRIIRTRVRLAGPVLDDRRGLALKAYLIRTRGVDDSPVNQYAPFYLWNSPTAMTHFLLGGGGFQNIVRDFGRPPVSHWTAVAATQGAAATTPPLAASRQLTPLTADTSIESAVADLRSLAARPDLHTAALAYDPRSWHLVRFTLWRTEVPPDQAGERYEVLHLSAPEPAAAL